MKNQIKPIFTSFVMIISFITNISAAWIEREPIQLVQPNGDRVSAFISGDEFHNWIHDAEGFTIVKDNITSQYCWAIIENDELVSSGYPINQYMARNLCLEPYLNISDEAYREKRREWDEDFQNYRSSTPKTGEAHNIVIFITFPWGANYDPRIHGDAVFNNPFSVYENNFLDLNTYFWDASYQQLDVSSSFYPIQHGSNVVSHEADKERYYYTLEGAGYDLSIQIDRFNNLLKEAVSKIENMVPVGLNIDRNNDGIVDNVIFIIEGRIQSGSFWPSWGFFSGQPTLTIHDKVVRNYNIIIESSHTSDNDYANFRFIHILHEFAHSIGANDLYNRSTPDWRFDPVGPWCIMARSRDIVSSISSIVKYRDLGWIDIPTITTSGNYTLHPLSLQENNIVYRINSPYSENQYFIVEYRRKVASKFPDSNLLFRYDQISIQDPHGLIVYRIAGGSSVTGQYGVYIYHPHEVDKLYGVLNAFFSADSGRTAINDNTNPSSDIYLHGATLTKGGLDISNIGIAGDTISFDVTIPDLTQPVYVDPVNFDLCPYTYETIQEAINEVYNHGTVIIYPHPDGAYTGIGNKELSWVEDKKINIVGIDSVVIDCEEDDFFITSNNDNLISINNIKIINVKRALAFYGFSEIIVENVIMENYSINGIYANSANGANELLIINCQFLGTSVSNYQSRAIDVAVDKLTIKNSIFQDNSGAYGSSINYHGYKLHLEGNTFQNNITTSSRATIYVDFNRVEYDGYINILDNVFLNNETRAGGSGQDRAVNLTITNVNLFSNVLIARNLFLQDNNNHPSFPCIIISGSSSNDTKIEYTNNTEMGFGNLSQYALFLSVENIPVSIKNSIFTGRIHTTNAANKTIMNSWFTNSNDPNNNIYIHGMISGIFLYNRHNLLAGNPHFTMTSLDPADPSNYYPVWNSSIKSGLINAAYLDTNSNGIPFWDDLDDGKFDGTNQDIGAVQNTRKQYVIQHDLNPDSEYIWLSFPYLDRLYGSGGGIFSHSRLSYVLGIQNENNLLSLNPRYIEYIEWKYEDSIGKVYYDDTTNYWIGDLNHLIDSRHGYKIKLNSNVTYPRPLVTNGFYCGTTNNPQNQITISAREPGEDYREVWLGYYGLNLQDPFFVFDSIIDNLIQIKTQQWSMNRDIDLSIWALPANAVSLNFGEMVSIKYIGDEDATLYFPQMFSLEDMSRYHHPTPSHFTYIEQSDYIPIYVHLPDDLTEEGIGEIGLFINDVCYGAEVIMGEVAQINAYIMDLDFDDTDIEFQIMEYGSRSGEKRFENFEVFDSVVNEFRSTTLDLNNGEMFYVVSLKNVNDMVDDLPKFTSLDGNFPNPFNPSTTIAYSLAESGNVKLQIFNIRGQLVKTLVNEIQNAGRYTVDWHGDNDRQRRVGSGVYFYRLETSAGRQVKRMVLLK